MAAPCMKPRKAASLHGVWKKGTLLGINTGHSKEVGDSGGGMKQNKNPQCQLLWILHKKIRF